MALWNFVRNKLDINFYGWVCPTCSWYINPDMYEIDKTVSSDRLNKEVVVEAPAACISCGALLPAPLTEEGLVRLKELVKTAKNIFGDNIPDIIKRWEFYYLDG